MRCFVCRKKKTNPGKLLFFPLYSVDEVTKEKFMLCSDCYKKISNRKSEGSAHCASLNVRESVEYYYQNGQLTTEEIEYIYQDFSSDDAKLMLGSTPTFILPIKRDYIAIDEPTKRLIINNKIVSFSEIESYKVFDKSIEYHIQAPNSTQYEMNTDKGLRRSIVGGMFAGPAGAVMGGLTANHSMVISEGMKSTYNTTEHDFDVLVLLKSFNQGGSIAIKIGNDEIKLQAVVNLIEKILN